MYKSKHRKVSDWALIALVLVTIISVISVFTTPNAMASNNQQDPNKTVISDTVITPPEVSNENDVLVDETQPQTPLQWAETDVITFDESITFEYEFVTKDGYLPYALYTPSTAATNKETPLIVWLHGSGERNVSESTFKSRGFNDLMQKWSTEGFNAYVISPQLHNGYTANAGVWCDSTSAQQVKDIIDMAIAEYGVDPDRVVLCGHSLGGQGTTFIASKLQGYFANVVVLSGYDCWIDISNIDIPIRGYVGTAAGGEDEASYHYMTEQFARRFGSDNVFTKATTHGNVPYWVFGLDEDGNNRADIIEWMFANM